MRLFLITSGALLLLSACATQPVAVPEPVVPILPSSTPTTAPTNSPMPPTETSELPSPTLLSPTATTLPTATWTPTAEPTVATLPTIQPTATVMVALTGNPERGRELTSLYACNSCHSFARPFPGGDLAPNLGNIPLEAARIISSPEYTGSSSTVEEYLRESILTPNVYIVPGENYLRAPGVSAMKQDFAEKIPAQDLDDLIAYLMTLDVQ